MKPVGYEVDPNPRLDAIFSALADPTRRGILARLAEGEASVGELAEPLDISQPAVSKHLRTLERAGLITRRADGTRRPATLRPEGLGEASEWLRRHRVQWEAKLDRLEDVLKQLT